MNKFDSAKARNNNTFFFLRGGGVGAIRSYKYNYFYASLDMLLWDSNVKGKTYRLYETFPYLFLFQMDSSKSICLFEMAVFPYSRLLHQPSSRKNGVFPIHVCCVRTFCFSQLSRIITHILDRNAVN